MFADVIRTKIIDYQANPVPKYIPRDISVSHVSDMVTTIVGVRKAGKSYLTYQLIDELIADNFIPSRKQVCYLHFDDEQLMGLSVEDLHLIDELFYSLLAAPETYPNVVFIFDEIHKISGWENFVLRIKKILNTIVIVTGSSSDLEENRVARQLRGKTLTYHLLPLSFREFLKFRGIDIVAPNRFSSAAMAKYQDAFLEYLNRGSFPALANINQKLLLPILKNYYHSVVEADFLLTESVGNTMACKDFVTYLLHNHGGKYTHKKTFNTLRSFGHKFTHESIPAWYDLAKRCYFMDDASIYTASVKKIQQNYRKIYCVDWALANAVSFPTEKRFPAMLESIVFWELKRRKKQLSYHLLSNIKYEVDFLVYDFFQKPECAIQVCCDISKQEVLEREIRPFSYLTKQFPDIKKLLIVKEKPSAKINIPSDISIVSMWSWLIEDGAAF